jgi:hypothetical protein
VLLHRWYGCMRPARGLATHVGSTGAAGGGGGRGRGPTGRPAAASATSSSAAAQRSAAREGLACCALKAWRPRPRPRARTGTRPRSGQRAAGSVRRTCAACARPRLGNSGRHAWPPHTAGPGAGAATATPLDLTLARSAWLAGVQPTPSSAQQGAAPRHDTSRVESVKRDGPRPALLPCCFASRARVFAAAAAAAVGVVGGECTRRGVGRRGRVPVPWRRVASFGKPRVRLTVTADADESIDIAIAVGCRGVCSLCSCLLPLKFRTRLEATPPSSSSVALSLCGLTRRQAFRALGGTHLARTAS